MTDAPDLAELARRYLDLWQAQLSQAAADPETAESLRQLFDLLAATAQPAGGVWPLAGWPQGDRSEDAAPTTAPGTAPPGPAPDGGGGEFDDLTRRLADVEKRLAALESGTGGGSRKPAAKPRKRKS